MARDRAIQLAVEDGGSPPTLRLYQWDRPTLTLGRFQPDTDIDASAARQLGIDVVRRFTGGRAVLHDDELTYAVIARTADGIPRGVAASYRHLCAALAEAYRRIGVAASLTAHDRVHAPSAACYLAASRADLSLDAMKLAGSAQVWHGQTVLQHGSFTITRSVDQEARLFGMSREQAALFAERTATIHSATGQRPDPDSLVGPVAASFGEVLGIGLVPGVVSAAESELERSLLEEVKAVGQRCSADTAGSATDLGD